MVELQSAQAFVHRVEDVYPGETGLVGARSHALVDLGGQYELIAGDSQIAQGLARHDLRAARVIDIRGVDEVDAMVEGCTDNLVDRRLFQLADTAPQAIARTESHGTEAQLRNEQAGVAEFLQLHRVLREGRPAAP